MNYYLLFCLLISLAINATAIIEKKVVVFGCFDLFHEGHKDFLQQASAYGDVIVIITPDAIIEKLKKRKPVQSQDIRLKKVQEYNERFVVIFGDQELGTYTVLRQCNPHLICLGYDQEGLYNDLAKRMNNGQIPKIPMIFLEPYEEFIYHTSIIREKLKL